MLSDMKQRIAIIGLGYVGLPLALLANKKGYSVIGLDIDANKIKKLLDKKSPINDKLLQEKIKKSSIEFTSDFSSIKFADIVVLCVPTPVDESKLPDLSPLRNAVENIAEYIETDKLLIIESTINPGVCDEVITPLIELGGRLKVGKNIYIAHCPERINPGDKNWRVDNINRVLGADSPKGLNLAQNFYESIINAEIKLMGTIKEAEAVKIVENSFRDINIAYVNELAKSFHLMGINLENVIEGAATKPFAFMPHHPGMGVGGHCIPVDPYYLIEHAKGFGFDHKFLKLAREINESMPEYTIELIEDTLAKQNLTKINTKIVVLGQAYKPDIDDARESPAIKLYSAMIALGYNIKRYEPFISDKSDFNSLKKALLWADAAIIATAHSEFTTLDISNYKKCGIRTLIDGRNIYHQLSKDFKRDGITYCGIGV